MRPVHKDIKITVDQNIGRLCSDIFELLLDAPTLANV